MARSVDWTPSGKCKDKEKRQNARNRRIPNPKPRKPHEHSCLDHQSPEKSREIARVGMFDLCVTQREVLRRRTPPKRTTLKLRKNFYKPFLPNARRQPRR